MVTKWQSVSALLLELLGFYLPLLVIIMLIIFILDLK